MVLFVGYDPGGNGRHGVAAAHIASNGIFESEPVLKLFPDARTVRGWLTQQASLAALGIDTLLAWSDTGGRACDTALRRRYISRAPSVIPQNSLYSAMTINGILVAQTGLEIGVPLVESHPKLLVRAALHSDPEGDDLGARHHALVNNALGDFEGRADDVADALVAAWCASRWWFKRWQTDLYEAIPDVLTFPAGPAVYPWPEPVIAGREAAVG